MHHLPRRAPFPVALRYQAGQFIYSWINFYEKKYYED